MGRFITLERSPLTQTWTLEERSALAHFLEEKKIQNGSLVVTGQSREQCVYFIDSGGVRVVYENIAVELQEGDSFGELSLITNTKKMAPIMTTKDTTLWVLTEEKWSHMRLVAPSIMLKFLEAVIQKFAKLLNETVPPPASMSSLFKLD